MVKRRRKPPELPKFLSRRNSFRDTEISCIHHPRHQPKRVLRIRNTHLKVQVIQWTFVNWRTYESIWKWKEIRSELQHGYRGNADAKISRNYSSLAMRMLGGGEVGRVCQKHSSFQDSEINQNQKSFFFLNGKLLVMETLWYFNKSLFHFSLLSW